RKVEPQSSKRLRISELNPHLLCALCGGYLIDATTIIECLHAFCKTCILRYLETSNYCPICEVLIHKTRPWQNIRLDHSLQNAVYKMVPGLFQNEMKRRREFYEKLKQTDKKVWTCSSSEGELGDRIIFSQDEEFSISIEFSPDGQPVKETTTTLQKKHKCTYQPEKRYLKCPAALRVEHLKKFIRSKFSLPPNIQIDLFQEKEPLCDTYTLMDVAYIHMWKRDCVLRLFYSFYEIPPKIRKLETVSVIEKVNKKNKEKKEEKTQKRKTERKSKTKKEKNRKQCKVADSVSSNNDSVGQVQTKPNGQKLKRKHLDTYPGETDLQPPKLTKSSLNGLSVHSKGPPFKQKSNLECTSYSIIQSSNAKEKSKSVKEPSKDKTSLKMLIKSSHLKPAKEVKKQQVVKATLLSNKPNLFERMGSLTKCSLTDQVNTSDSSTLLNHITHKQNKKLKVKDKKCNKSQKEFKSAVSNTELNGKSKEKHDIVMETKLSPGNRQVVVDAACKIVEACSPASVKSELKPELPSESRPTEFQCLNLDSTDVLLLGHKQELPLAIHGQGSTGAEGVSEVLSSEQYQPSTTDFQKSAKNTARNKSKEEAKIESPTTSSDVFQKLSLKEEIVSQTQVVVKDDNDSGIETDSQKSVTPEHNIPFVTNEIMTVVSLDNKQSVISNDKKSGITHDKKKSDILTSNRKSETPISNRIPAVSKSAPKSDVINSSKSSVMSHDNRSPCIPTDSRMFGRTIEEKVLTTEHKTMSSSSVDNKLSVISADNKLSISLDNQVSGLDTDNKIKVDIKEDSKISPQDIKYIDKELVKQETGFPEKCKVECKGHLNTLETKESQVSENEKSLLVNGSSVHCLQTKVVENNNDITVVKDSVSPTEITVSATDQESQGIVKSSSPKKQTVNLQKVDSDVSSQAKSLSNGVLSLQSLPEPPRLVTAGCSVSLTIASIVSTSNTAVSPSTISLSGAKLASSYTTNTSSISSVGNTLISTTASNTKPTVTSIQKVDLSPETCEVQRPKDLSNTGPKSMASAPGKSKEKQHDNMTRSSSVPPVSISALFSNGSNHSSGKSAPTSSIHSTAPSIANTFLIAPPIPSVEPLSRSSSHCEQNTSTIPKEAINVDNFLFDTKPSEKDSPKPEMNSKPRELSPPIKQPPKNILKAKPISSPEEPRSSVEAQLTAMHQLPKTISQTSKSYSSVARSASSSSASSSRSNSSVIQTTKISTLIPKSNSISSKSSMYTKSFSYPTNINSVPSSRSFLHSAMPHSLPRNDLSAIINGTVSAVNYQRAMSKASLAHSAPKPTIPSSPLTHPPRTSTKHGAKDGESKHEKTSKSKSIPPLTIPKATLGSTTLKLQRSPGSTDHYIFAPAASPFGLSGHHSGEKGKSNKDKHNSRTLSSPALSSKESVYAAGGGERQRVPTIKISDINRNPIIVDSGLNNHLTPQYRAYSSATAGSRAPVENGSSRNHLRAGSECGSPNTGNQRSARETRRPSDSELLMNHCYGYTTADLLFNGFKLPSQSHPKFPDLHYDTDAMPLDYSQSSSKS
ncbi:polycomb complex protein BMI-1-A, partial [Biomphalaria pfeifferi]